MKTQNEFRDNAGKIILAILVIGIAAYFILMKLSEPRSEADFINQKASEQLHNSASTENPNEAAKDSSVNAIRPYVAPGQPKHIE